MYIYPDNLKSKATFGCGSFATLALSVLAALFLYSPSHSSVGFHPLL